MQIENSYLAVSKFFDSWVRVMERQTRLWEVQDSQLNRQKILIISPPTDRGVKILADSNANGQSTLLCFSPALETIAREYAAGHSLTSLETVVGKFFSIPFEDGYFDAVYANCFFDFVSDKAFRVVIKEIKRALKPGGQLFAVYMAYPKGFIGRTWAYGFKQFPLLSQGCHPVDIKPYLLEANMRMRKDLSVKRLGFPVAYLVAEKW